MAVKGFNVGGAINRYDFNSLVNKEGAVTAEMLGSDVTTQLTTMSGNISTLQSQVATLDDGYTNLGIGATEILQQLGIPTAATSYACNWAEYDLLIITPVFYGNRYQSVVVSTSYFGTTSSGNRVTPVVYSQSVNLSWNVYQNGGNAVYISANASDSARGINIVGVKLAK